MKIEQIQNFPKTLAQNCWILRNGRSAIIIDPGCKTAEPVLKKIENRKLIAVLLTHNHFDHIRGLDELVTQTKAPVFIHPTDAEVVENGWNTM